MIIGQMGSNFSQNLLRFKLRALVVQGPGFNTMGTDVFSLAKIATSFSYTDSAGAALINTQILCDLLKVASKFSPDVIKYRNMTIWGFLNIALSLRNSIFGDIMTCRTSRIFSFCAVLRKSWL